MGNWNYFEATFTFRWRSYKRNSTDNNTEFRVIEGYIKVISSELLLLSPFLSRQIPFFSHIPFAQQMNYEATLDLIPLILRNARRNNYLGLLWNPWTSRSRDYLGADLLIVPTRIISNEKKIEKRMIASRDSLLQEWRRMSFLMAPPCCWEDRRNAWTHGRRTCRSSHVSWLSWPRASLTTDLSGGVPTRWMRRFRNAAGASGLR